VNGDLLRAAIRVEHDVFVVRQRGREVAAVLGMEHQDQIRIATALSEIGRVMLAHSDGAEVTFQVTSPPATLVVTVTAMAARPPPAAEFDETVAVVGRLVDEVRLEHDGQRVAVSLRRLLPAAVAPTDEARLAQARAQLERSAPTSAVAELSVQNRQLLATLEEVQRQRDQLLQLNAELAETNRGVLALYGQLSEELDETNRGVVALYAELDQRSAELRDASEAKSRFLASVSHELRAPLTAILGLCRLLADPGSDPLTEEQAHQVRLVNSSALNLLGLVNDLLDLAKAESGRIEADVTAVELSSVLGLLRGSLRGFPARPGVDVIIADAGGVTFATDEKLLLQVLRNLVTNALKFTERGEVRLDVREAGDCLELAVSDTGIGIAAEEQDRIFEEFYQVPNGLQAAAGGTGLGLPYARRLVAALGGSLTLDSTPGRGSTFTVRLPRTRAGADAASTTTGVAPPAGSGAAQTSGTGVAPPAGSGAAQTSGTGQATHEAPP
jgi:signal transduction histidine kinase